MNRKNLCCLVGTSLLIFLVVTIPVCGQTQDDDEWQFTVAPYLVFTGMSGTIGARGFETDVNASVSDVFSNLQMGFNGYFEARKGNWAFGTDVVYAALGGSTDYVNVDPSEALFTFLGMRRLAPGFDLTFGARVNAIRNKIEFKENLGPPLGGSTIEATKQWVDPLIGFHWSVPLGKRLHFTLPANIGGFGISSKIALDVYPNIQFQVGKRAWIAGGWRITYINYESGYEDGMPVLGSDAFRFDMTTTGPAIGMAFRF